MGTPQYVDAGMLTGNIDAGGYSSSIYNIYIFVKFQRKWNVNYMLVSEFCTSASSLPGTYSSRTRAVIRKRVIEFFKMIIHPVRQI